MNAVDEKVYEYMVQFQDEQAMLPVGPSARQVVEALGLSGPGHVDQIWKRLEREGRVAKAPGRNAHDRYAIHHPTYIEALIKQLDDEAEKVAQLEGQLSSVMENVTAALALVRDGDLVNSADVLAKVIEQ